MIDFLTACWFGVIGACVGSFLNVVAYRMPLGMSVIWKPSHCPKCKTQISACDNVPVLGWLWLRGKCRSCSEPISPRYAIVEAVMGLTFFVLCYAEVFSGGANLPTGPLTSGRGALENVIEPNWTVLGVYGFHCAVMSYLMCQLLINHDRQEMKHSLGSTVFVAGTVALSLFWTPLKQLILFDPNWLHIGVVVALVFVLCWMKFYKDEMTNASEKPSLWIPTQTENQAIIATIVFLGLSATATFSILMIIVAVALFKNGQTRELLEGRVIASSCFISALLQIIFWNELHSALRIIL